MQLNTELKYFKSIKKELLRKHGGAYVLLKGKKVIDFYDDEEAAYIAGVQKFRGAPFLIKKIAEEVGVDFVPFVSVGV